MTAIHGHIIYSIFPGASSRTHNTKSKCQIYRYADLRGPLRNHLLWICSILFVSVGPSKHSEIINIQFIWLLRKPQNFSLNQISRKNSCFSPLVMEDGKGSLGNTCKSRFLFVRSWGISVDTKHFWGFCDHMIENSNAKRLIFKGA